MKDPAKDAKDRMFFPVGVGTPSGVCKRGADIRTVLWKSITSGRGRTVGGVEYPGTAVHCVSQLEKGSNGSSPASRGANEST